MGNPGRAAQFLVAVVGGASRIASFMAGAGPASIVVDRLTGLSVIGRLYPVISAAVVLVIIGILLSNDRGAEICRSARLIGLGALFFTASMGADVCSGGQCAWSMRTAAWGSGALGLMLLVVMLRHESKIDRERKREWPALRE